MYVYLFVIPIFQLSEPMDIVWWVDKLPVKDDFAKRLGLNTYLVRGYNKVVRYYPYFDATFDLTRDIIIERGFYDKE